ncbi:MAG: hypothetical protein EHM17_13890 [Verrucomicrobiaceae bacterium]|nr:MAG: hypothetical protein EHM17_13890 [Verrucomicrobiaceae bacterium]
MRPDRLIAQSKAMARAIFVVGDFIWRFVATWKIIFSEISPILLRRFRRGCGAAAHVHLTLQRLEFTTIIKCGRKHGFRFASRRYPAYVACAGNPQRTKRMNAFAQANWHELPSEQATGLLDSIPANGLQ